MCKAIGLSQLTNTFIKVFMKFHFCNATYRAISTIERQVDEIVQIAKHTHLTKLGYTCKKRKTYLGIQCFQYGIESL